MTNVIAFQGRPGAYSDLACRARLPELADPALRDLRGRDRGGARAAPPSSACCPARTASPAGCRISTRLLPDSGLTIVGEAFQRVEHCLLAPKGATIAGLKRAHSHAVALGQVRRVIKELNLTPVIEADTAGAAEQVAGWNNPEDAAIASELAAELFGLEILRRNVEDAAHNTTRFYVVSRERPPLLPTQPGIDHHLRVPGAQRSRGAVQGARRLRHQRREHDQARELHARRPVHRHPVPLRRGRPPGIPRRCAGRWKSSRSSRARCGSSACTRPRRSARSSRKQTKIGAVVPKTRCSRAAPLAPPRAVGPWLP